MCWKVLTLKLCFVINPACVCVSVSNFVTHQTEIAECVCMCVCRDAMCLCEPVKGERAYSCFDLSRLSRLRLGTTSISPLLVISPFKATSHCVPQPALNFLSFFVLTELFLDMAVVGRVYCYPPLPFSDSSPSYVPSPMHGEKKSRTDWKLFSQNFKEVMKRVPARCPPPRTPLSLQDPDKIPLLTHINQLHCLIWFWLHLNSHPCQTSLLETGLWNEKHVFKKLGRFFFCLYTIWKDYCLFEG